MTKIKTKKSHLFLVKQTAEEKEWEHDEELWNDGYEAGVTDWVEVERRKQQLRAKGFKVIGD